MQSSRPTVAVVGHVEWVQFARVPHVPRAGEVVHAERPVRGAGGRRSGGGGPAGAARGRGDAGDCLGEDESPRALARGWPSSAWTCARRRAERDTQRGDAGRRRGRAHDHDVRPAPGTRAATACRRAGRGWSRSTACTSPRATRPSCEWRARARARLVASPRASEALAPGVVLDALVLSGEDEVELRAAEPVRKEAELVVVDGRHARRALPAPRGETGSAGPRCACPARRWTPTVAVTRSRRASRTASARAWHAPSALALGARCGAVCLTGRGPYERQLTARDL